MAANPHFLKLFLACLAWATDEGFSVHYVFENWLCAESVGQLLEAILRSMEAGFTPDQHGIDDAHQFLVENNFSKGQTQLSNLPIRRKISAGALPNATDKYQQQHLTGVTFPHGGGIGGSSHIGGGYMVDESSSSVSSSGGRSLTSSSKEYGYHDARIPDGAPAYNEKTISSSVIELKYDDTLPRRSSMPIRDGSANNPVAVTTTATIMMGITRMDSAHETKEVFVPTLRNDIAAAARGHANTIQEALGIPSSPISFMANQPVAAGLPSSSLGLSGSSSPLRIGSGDNSRSISPAKPMLSHSHHISQSIRLPPSATSLSLSKQSSSREDELPAYLTGGADVHPLGELLGRAFCLLYVCRHGMLMNELRFILNAIVAEEREVSSKQLHRKASFSNVKNLEQQDLTGFSEAEWKALLRAMKPLGVLFVQDVVVLPICKEILREVVWWRYIGSERVEQKYHQWLIRFFRIHPTTFRRVEELPWHLKRCYQWDALRNVLVNLPMFQLLCAANYKNELFGYWKTLTDGPLLIYNASETAASSDALVYALPFGIVKEYGKSVEAWYKSARPPTKVFIPIVQLVTKFMYEFSLYYQGYLPGFNYAPLDLKKLYHDGFSFIEDLPHVQSPSASAMASGAAVTAVTSGASMAASAAVTAISALTTALESFTTLGPGYNSNNSVTASNAGSGLGLLAGKEKEGTGNWFYFYQRWIWIQFPWLALSKEIVIREPFVSPNNITGSSSHSGSISSSSAQLTVTSGSSSLDSGHTLGSDLSGDGGDEEQRREGELARNGASNTLLAPLHHASLSGGGGGGKPIIHFNVRFWDVKKSMFEPHSSTGTECTLKKKGLANPSKIVALQNSSILPPAPTAKTQDLISPENLFRKKATYVAVKNVLSSSIRRLPTAVANAALPRASVSEHGGAGNNNNSNSNTLITEASLSTGDPNGLDLQPQLDLNLLTGNSKVSPATRDLVLEHLNVSDTSSVLSTAFGLPAHFQDYPQSEWDLKKAYNY